MSAVRSGRGASTAISWSAPGTSTNSTGVPGDGEPGFEADRVPSYAVKVEGGKVLGQRKTRYAPQSSAASAAARGARAEAGAGRGARRGISTTAMDAKNPRYSTSDALLASALEGARTQCGAEVRLVKLNDLAFPELRRLLLEVCAGLHLAVLDHADGCQDRMVEVYELVVALGRRADRRDAHPLGARARSTTRWSSA